MGGEDSTLGDLIYLNISTSFNVADAQSKWQTVPPGNGLTPEVNYAYGMGVIPEENSIMIYGGSGYNVGGRPLMSPVTLFNATSNSWKIVPDPPGNIKQ